MKKIILPENQSDITLEQYQKYCKLIERTDLDTYSLNRRLIQIFTNLSYKETEGIIQKDFEFCVEQITKALNEEVSFIPTFELGGFKFGFIENISNLTNKEIEEIEKFDKMTFGEFVDTDNYMKSIDEMHKLMVILFRPIVDSDRFGNYKVAEYNGTDEFAEVMKQTPLSVVNGALFFFSNLSTELEIYIQRYTQEVLKRAGNQ